MPLVDMKAVSCKWCGTTTDVRLCDTCHCYSCFECKLAVTEEGCYHKAKKIVVVQTWDAIC